jgi:hypothetical protein
MGYARKCVFLQKKSIFAHLSVILPQKRHIDIAVWQKMTVFQPKFDYPTMVRKLLVY